MNKGNKEDFMLATEFTENTKNILATEATENIEIIFYSSFPLCEKNLFRRIRCLRWLK